MSEFNNSNYAYFGGGCFWCVEAVFEDLNGVSSVVNGYSGGEEKTANYRDVSSGKSEHAEICRIMYNPNIISFDILLEVFFSAHDPTTVNRQGADVGSQYRSIIFYSNIEQRDQIKIYIKKLEQNETYNKIVTELKPFKKFYPAEKYHQNYFNLNPNEPYCSFIINPKVQKIRKKLTKYYQK